MERTGFKAGDTLYDLKFQCPGETHISTAVGKSLADALLHALKILKMSAERTVEIVAKNLESDKQTLEWAKAAVAKVEAALEEVD